MSLYTLRLKYLTQTALKDTTAKTTFVWFNVNCFVWFLLFYKGMQSDALLKVLTKFWQKIFNYKISKIYGKDILIKNNSFY